MADHLSELKNWGIRKEKDQGEGSEDGSKCGIPENEAGDSEEYQGSGENKDQWLEGDTELEMLDIQDKWIEHIINGKYPRMPVVFIQNLLRLDPYHEYLSMDF